jgi:hypothetical protein
MLKLLVYGALSYKCMRPYATSVCGLTLLVHERTLEPLTQWSLHKCASVGATSVCGLKLHATSVCGLKLQRMRERGRLEDGSQAPQSHVVFRKEFNNMKAHGSEGDWDRKTCLRERA